MSNDYYNNTANTLTSNEVALAADVEGKFDEVVTAFEKLPSQASLVYGTGPFSDDTGTANAYLIALSTTLTSYTDGLAIAVRILNTNTGASTLNVDSVAAKSIKRSDGSVLAAGDLTAGGIAEMRYDGDNDCFVLLSVSANFITAAETAQTAAETAQTAAELAETNAETAQTAAEAAQTAAETAETNAETAETNAAASVASINVGTDIGDLVNLVDVGGGTPGFPAVDGSNLTNVTDAAAMNDLSDDTDPTLAAPLKTDGHQIQASLGASVVSATELPVLTDGNTFPVTGTTEIETIADIGIGTEITLVHLAAHNLKHSASLLLKNNGDDILPEVGDVSKWYQKTASIWEMTSYTRANGTALGGGLTLLATLTASADATISFDEFIDDTYDEYEIHLLNVIPATDGVIFQILTSSNGGTSYDTGASDYSWVNSGNRIGNVINTGDASDTHIAILGTQTIGSEANENGVSGIITLIRPSESTYTELTASRITAVRSADGDFFTLTASGRRLEAAAVNAIRFLFSAGNIESGIFKLYGVAK